MIETIAAIASISILEVVLSIDNALVNASLAEKLPKSKQHKAIYTGIGLGALLRVVVLLAASVFLKNPIIKVLAALYLCYLSAANLITRKKGKKNKEKIKKHSGFFKVIVQIVFTDLVFSIDNILGALGLSKNIWIVVIGVLIGIVGMLFVTQLMLFFMKRFPTLERTAYFIIAFIGLNLLAEVFFSIDISKIVQFCVIVSMLSVSMLYDKIKS